MTGAVILAAGRGSRFGGGKLLALIDGRPMLAHVLDLARSARLEPIVLVVGDDAEAIDAVIPAAGETRVRNAHPDRGISSSLKLGLSAVANAQRVLVLMGDQPFLKVEQLGAIAAVERDPTRPIVVPRYADGRPGNPVLLEREAWPLADALKGDRGMSQLFAARPDLVRYVDLAGTNPDVDTAADLAALSRAEGPGQSARTAAAGRNTP